MSLSLSLSPETLSAFDWAQDDSRIVLFMSSDSPETVSEATMDNSRALGICLQDKCETLYNYLYIQKLQDDEDPYEESTEGCYKSVFHALDTTKLLAMGTPFILNFDSPTSILGLSLKDDDTYKVVGLSAQADDTTLTLKKDTSEKDTALTHEKDTVITPDEILMNCMVENKDESKSAKRKRVTLSGVQYGDKSLKSREANSAAISWMQKYAKDYVKINMDKGPNERYELLLPSRSGHSNKWKRIRTLTECVFHVMEISGRNFWDDMRHMTVNI